MPKPTLPRKPKRNGRPSCWSGIKEERFRNRVRRIDGLFEDDLGTAWFSERWPAAGIGDKLAPNDSGE